MQSTLVCEQCGKTVDRKSNRQRLCPDCRPKVYRIRATECERRRRKELGPAYLAYDKQNKSKPEYREKQRIRAKKRREMVRNNPVLLDALRSKYPEYNDRFLNKRDFGGNWYKVYERDDGKCQACGSTDKVCVHHKDRTGWGVPREEKNNEMSNLILLCSSCHARIHRNGEFPNPKR
jgi:hypothetical protein